MSLQLSEVILKILEYVYSNPGVTISDIRKKFKLIPSTATTILKRLSKFNLVQIVDDEIKATITNRDGTTYTRSIKVKRVLPSYIKCNNDGSIILPKIYKINDSFSMGLVVFKCPFAKECPYVNKKTLVPGYCKLYDMLSDKDKEEIKNLYTTIQSLIDMYKKYKSEES